MTWRSFIRCATRYTYSTSARSSPMARRMRSRRTRRSSRHTWEATMTTLLEVENLHASYGAIQALRGITFQLSKGQVVSLIGANGAGKSTTLNTISGLLKPTAGRVRFQGQDITGWRADIVAAQGLVQVPEGRRIIATMTVHENLVIGTHLRRTANLKDQLDRIYQRFPR